MSNHFAISVGGPEKAGAGSIPSLPCFQRLADAPFRVLVPIASNSSPPTNVSCDACPARLAKGRVHPSNNKLSVQWITREFLKRELQLRLSKPASGGWIWPPWMWKCHGDPRVGPGLGQRDCQSTPRRKWQWTAVIRASVRTLINREFQHSVDSRSNQQ
jgi:hypothetical protein